MKVILYTGDPSQDGHNFYDNHILETDATVEEIEETFKTVNKKLGLNIDILTDYDESQITYDDIKSVFEKIPETKTLLSKCMLDANGWLVTDKTLNDSDVLNDFKNGNIVLEPDVDIYVELFCMIMNHANLKLNLRKIKYPKLSFSIGYGLWEYTSM